MRKLLLYTLLLFLAYSCANYSKSKSEPFKIEGATYNYWSGGLGASGIKIIIRCQSIDSVDFKRVFFKDKSGTLEHYSKEGKSYLIGHISTSTFPGDDVPEGVKKPKQEIPVQFPFKLKENEIAISYLESKKLKYYLVKNAKQTPTDYFP